MRGKPDSEVVVFRSVPAAYADLGIRSGDWVTLSRRYAEQHGWLDPQEKPVIVEARVPARQVWWNGDSLYEFGYDDTQDIDN